MKIGCYVLTWWIFSLLTGCTSGVDEGPWSVDKTRILEASSTTSTQSLCERFGFAADCDLCDEFGWYQDDECDSRLIAIGVCAGPDPVCSNVGDGDGDLQKIRIQGEFRTSAPALDNPPVRVLLVVDTSESLKISDKDGHRLDAVSELITGFTDSDQDIAVGMIGFNTAARALTDGFVDIIPDNMSQITTALSGLDETAGFTNYLAALDMAASMLQVDIKQQEELIQQAMQDGLDTSDLRPWYHVIFFSDGMPKLPASHNLPQSTEGILFKVKQVTHLASAAVSGIKLHTAFLAAFDPTTAEEPKTLLRKMAEEGRGSFVNFENGEEIDFSLFDLSDTRLYDIKEYMIFNRNAVLKGGRLLADSDGDGLADMDEEGIGTDPLSRDTDGDFLGDGYEIMAKLDPKRFDHICTADLAGDLDGDGLNDCEELFINLDPELFDTDGDGLVDGIEFYSGADPKDNADGRRDLDLDGVDTRMELIQRTDPRSNDRDDHAAYGYSFSAHFQTDLNTGQVVFDFEVTNISLVETQATSAHAAGENQLVLYFVEYSKDDPTISRLYQYTLSVHFASDLPEPLNISPEDFELISSQRLLDR